MKIAAMVAILTLGISLGTRAQAGELDGAPSAQPALVSPPVQEKPYSPAVAGDLAVLSPVLPIAVGSYLWGTATNNQFKEKVIGVSLIGLGLWIAPSAGHFYAGEWGHALGMSAFRVVTGGAGGIILFLATLHGDCEDGPAGACDTSTGAVLLGTGLLLAAGASAVYDMIDAPRAAERANQHITRDLALAPILSGDARGGSTRGLALVGRF